MYEAAPRPVVSQGDVFRDAFYVFPGPMETTSRLTIGKAVMLNRNCDYQKRNVETCLVAAVRPLSVIAPGDQGNIRTLKTRFAFYLAPIENVIEESFIDLRRIHVVNKADIEESCDAGEGFERLASLNNETRLAFQHQIAIFFGYGDSA